MTDIFKKHDAMKDIVLLINNDITKLVDKLKEISDRIYNFSPTDNTNSFVENNIADSIKFDKAYSEIIIFVDGLTKLLNTDILSPIDNHITSLMKEYDIHRKRLGSQNISLDSIKTNEEGYQILLMDEETHQFYVDTCEPVHSLINNHIDITIDDLSEQKQSIIKLIEAIKENLVNNLVLKTMLVLRDNDTYIPDMWMNSKEELIVMLNDSIESVENTVKHFVLFNIGLEAIFTIYSNIIDNIEAYLNISIEI